MKKLHILLFLLFFQLSTIHAKPFNKALVLAGGGLSLITYASLAKHLEFYGWKPDLIISTCGSSLSASTLMAYPDINDLENYLLSRNFHQLMLSPSISTKSVFELQKMITPVTPELNRQMFSKYILEIPDNFIMKGAPNKFPTTGTKYMMGAAKALFGEHSDFEKISDRFQETYFTDKKTAHLVDGRRSSIANKFPQSFVHDYVNARADLSPLQAARAGIADPLLTRPSTFNGNTYFTGGINLYPYEVAHDLANQVVMTYPLRFSKFMNDIVEYTFGYDASIRQKQASEQNIHWVDVHGKSNALFPTAAGIRVVEGVPWNYYTYKKLAKMEWNFGKKRAIETILAMRAKDKLANINVPFDDQKAGSVEVNFKKYLIRGTRIPGNKYKRNPKKP